MARNSQCGGRLALLVCVLFGVLARLDAQHFGPNFAPTNPNVAPNPMPMDRPPMDNRRMNMESMSGGIFEEPHEQMMGDFAPNADFMNPPQQEFMSGPPNDMNNNRLPPPPNPQMAIQREQEERAMQEREQMRIQHLQNQERQAIQAQMMNGNGQGGRGRPPPPAGGAPIHPGNGHGAHSPHVIVVQNPVPVVITTTGTVSTATTSDKQQPQAQVSVVTQSQNSNGDDNNGNGEQQQQSQQQNQQQKQPQNLQQGNQQQNLQQNQQSPQQFPLQPPQRRPNRLFPNMPPNFHGRRINGERPRSRDDGVVVINSELTRKNKGKAQAPAENAVENKDDTEKATSGEQKGAETSGSSMAKRDCLTGDCSDASSGSNSLTFVENPLCRGKECQLRIDNNQKRQMSRPPSGTVIPSREDKTTLTVVADRSSGSSSSEDVVCQLNNIPRVSECINSHPWKQVVKQPVNCGPIKRQWRCYCGFFDEQD